MSIASRLLSLILCSLLAPSIAFSFTVGGDVPVTLPGGTTYYYVQPTESDHGATTALGSSYYSVYDVIETVGTEESTLVFKHTGGADNTDYTFETDETIPAHIKLKFEKGARLSIATGVTVTIGNLGDAGLAQIFNCVGTGKVVFSQGAVDFVRPEWWGGIADNSTNSVAAFNHMVNTVNQNTDDPRTGVRLSYGTYVLPTAIDAIIGERGIRFRGTGVASTKINFTPTSAGVTLFTFGGWTGDGIGGANVSYGWDVGDFNIDGGGNSDTRTYIKTVEWSGPSVLSRVHIGASGTDTDSIGLKVCGRETATFEDIQIVFNGSGGRPIVFSKGGSAVPGIDHFNFRNIYLTSSSTTHPLIEVEDDVDMQNVTFDGYQAWVNGNGGFYADTSDVVDYYNLSFENVRYENSLGTITFANHNPTFNIEVTNGCSGVRWDSCQISVVKISDPAAGANKPTHVKLAGVSGAHMTSCIFSTPSGIAHTQWLEMDNTNTDFTGFNLMGNDGTGNETIHADVHTVLESKPRGTSDPRPPQNIMLVTGNSTDLAWPGLVHGDHTNYNKVVEIADAGTVELPFVENSSTALGTMQIFISYDKGDGTPTEGGGHFTVANDTSDNSAVKISGSTEIIAGTPTGGQAGVYKSVSNQAVILENQLGDSRKFSVVVFHSLD